MERSAVHTFLQKCSPTLRIFGVFNAKKAQKYAMFAEKMDVKTKQTEACERRIAPGGLIAMLAQTKRWGLDSKGKGWNRNLPFPLVAPLVFSDLRTVSEFSDAIRKFCVTSICVLFAL